MPADTLRRWASSELGHAHALVPVEVVADATDHVIDGRGVRIVTRSGHRIEGLTVADAIAIARVLG